ncbi:MAG TPA: Uma2 family endonuclease [Longimicrobium sp.]|nr:Uma2 family endonuclease [Longimicrobium sp.]
MAEAAAAIAPGFVTAEDLLRMPNDGVRRELVDGELRIIPPAGDEHGAIAGDILVDLGHYVRTHRLGRIYTAETGFTLASGPDTVLAPDASFVSRERIAHLGIGKGFRIGAPDLVVEVVSPGDSFGEVEAKVFKWLGAGCRMVIVVNPTRRAATVYRSRNDLLLLSENDAIDGGDVVPGWKLPLKEIFGAS